MSAAIEVVEQSLDDLREQRKVLVEELRVVDKLIDGQVKALDQVKPKVKAKPAPKQKDYKPNTASSAGTGTVSNLAAKRAAKSSGAPNKGGRPTKKVEFMKWLKENTSIERQRIPQQLNTSVQKVNEFVPELVREGLVMLDDRGDKHDPVEFVVITEKGVNA